MRRVTAEMIFDWINQAVLDDYIERLDGIGLGGALRQAIHDAYEDDDFVEWTNFLRELEAYYGEPQDEFEETRYEDLFVLDPDHLYGSDAIEWWNSFRVMLDARVREAGI